jgi:uncharacterized membrane protein YccC
MLLSDRRAWMFSAKLYVAAVATLGISLLGNLARPYWAMATVYVVSQPVLGMTRARGGYRILGTLLACAAVVVCMNFVQTPLLMSAMLALWLSGCLFIALLHRGPSGYTFMLASYTAAFIGFQAIATPEQIFDIAVARSEEIILGSLCAVVVASLVFPASAKPVINSRIGSWMDDAALWARQVLVGRKGQDGKTSRRTLLAADVAQFDTLITMARYDDPRHAAAHVRMQELRMRMLALLPVLGWIGDRLDNLRGRHADTPEQQQLLHDIAAWMERKEAPQAEAVAALHARVRAMRPEPSSDVDTLLANSLLLRLDELIELWSDCRRLQEAIAHGHEGTVERNFFRIDLDRINVLRQRHVDWPMIAFAAASVGVSLFSYCVLWIAIGWPGGAFGAMLGAVAAAFFAAQDDPTPSMLRMLLATIGSLALVAFYQFGVLPAVHDFGSLVLVLAPAFLLLGRLVYDPKTMPYALPMTVNLATLLNLRSTYNGDVQAFFNSSVSIVLGVGFAIIVTRLFRSVGAEWSARRLVRQAWKVIADAAAGHGLQDRELFTARMLDLLGQLAPRMAAVSASSGLATVDLLDEIRVGLNVLELRRARRDLPPVNAEAIDRLLLQVAAHYRAQAKRASHLPVPDALRQGLDASLSRVRSLPPGQGRDEGLLGLVGLRYSLAAAPTPALDPAPSAS